MYYKRDVKRDGSSFLTFIGEFEVDLNCRLWTNCYEYHVTYGSL